MHTVTNRINGKVYYVGCCTRLASEMFNILVKRGIACAVEFRP